MAKNAVRAAMVLGAFAATFANLAQAGIAQEATPRPAATATMCARPNVSATTIYHSVAVTPTMAEQQGIVGTVQVIVSLDRESNVVGTRIMTSPSAILNRAALAAARASTFQTEVRDCSPLAADFMYTVDFTNKVTFASTSSGEQQVEVIGEGSATRRADTAFILASVTTRDAGTGDVTVANARAFDALKAKLAPLGVSDIDIRTTWYLQPRTSPAPGATASRQLQITVRNLANIFNIVSSAVSAPSVDVSGIRFALLHRDMTYSEAVYAAFSDAERSARDAVARQQHHLGAVKRREAPSNDSLRAPTAFVPLRRAAAAGDLFASDIRIPDLEVRTTATVTYAVTP